VRVGIPVQVVSADDGATICAGRARRERIDVALAGASSVDGSSWI